MGASPVVRVCLPSDVFAGVFIGTYVMDLCCLRLFNGLKANSVHKAPVYYELCGGVEQARARSEIPRRRRVRARRSLSLSRRTLYYETEKSRDVVPYKI